MKNSDDLYGLVMILPPLDLGDNEGRHVRFKTIL